MSHAVPPDQYAQAAKRRWPSFRRKSRAAFVKMLQERAAARGVKLPGKVASDPKDLDTCLPIYMRSPVSSEISSVPAPRAKRQDRIPL